MVVRSSEWDFTVIPYVLLLLKFFNIIVWTNNKGEFFNELILQTYIVLGIIVCIISPFLKKLVKKLNPLHKPLPFPLLHSPELIEI